MLKVFPLKCEQNYNYGTEKYPSKLLKHELITRFFFRGLGVKF